VGLENSGNETLNAPLDMRCESYLYGVPLSPQVEMLNLSIKKV